MNRMHRQTAECVLFLLFIGAPMVYAQEHGHQRMMTPRVPADKLEEARAMVSPLSPSPEVVEQGKTIYEGKGTCVVCHGASGGGDGPGAANLNPPARVLRAQGLWRHRSEGEIFWVIKHGSAETAMIPFGGLLSDEEIWTVMQYEQSFAGGPKQRDGSPRGGGGRGGRHKGGGMRLHLNDEEGHGKREKEGHGERTTKGASPGLPEDQASENLARIQSAQAATISLMDAIAIAQREVKGTVIETKFEHEGERAFWKIEIATDDDRIMEVIVDSQSGAVLSSEEKSPDRETQQKQKRKGRGGGMKGHK
jgi:uncharacterized membrane protein YkoI/mono/diheme cytochrome c family protein